MNINVTTKNVTIDSEDLNKGEYNTRECNFTFSEEYDGLVCKALFTVSKTKLTYEQSIINNKCEIPYEATIDRGKVILGVIGYEIEDEELEKRYSPKPDEFFVLDGSYVEDIENQSTPTPSELEQLDARVSQVEIDAAQVEINTQDIATISVDYGKTIELSLDTSTFVLNAILKNKNGTVLSSSNIDLPIESMIINASYDNTTKELVLTLQNGNTVRVSVADLISGLQSEITSTNKLNADLVDDSTSTNKFVTASDKTNWNEKYTKPSGGIPKTDLASSVQTSLDKADTAVQDVSGKEDKTNKVTSLSSSSTDTQYPSAKCVYDLVGNIETILEELDIRRWRIMSISTRITSMQEHIGDIYDTLELGGVDLTNVDKNLINISPKLRQKYLDYMNNGTQEIWNNWEKVTGTGSDVKLDNTVQAPLNIVVGGNSEQVQYSGKNIINNDRGIFSINGLSFSYLGEGTYIINGTTTGGLDGYIGLTLNATLEKSTTYTMYYEVLEGSASNLGNMNFALNGTRDGTNISNMYYMSVDTITSKGIKKTTFTTSDKDELLRQTNIYIGGSGRVFNNLKIRCMVYKGTDNISYEPYVGGTASPNPSYPQSISNVTGDVEVVVQNKNLINVNKSESGGIDSSGNLVSGSEFWRSTDFIKVKPNTSYTISSNKNITLRLYQYDDNKNFISPRAEQLSNKLTITTTANTKYLKWALYQNSGITQEIVSNLDLQLEQGSATSYVSHQEQTYTFPLGTQRMFIGDYLADDGIHHVRKQTVFDGTENWVDYTTQVEGVYKAYTSALKTNSQFYQNALCSHLAVKSLSNYIIGREECITSNANATYICVSNSIASNATELQTWLSTNNIKVEYELEEEEITPYTTAQQTAYNQIKQALSYNEQTNISGESDGAKPILTATALINF